MGELLLLIIVLLVALLIVTISGQRSLKNRIKELKEEQDRSNREILKRIYEIKNMIDGDV